MTTEPLIEEEPWEGDVGTMLGQLPMVAPPDGFIDAALDHRPLHAGRILAGLLVATIGLMALASATGVVERAGVVPPIDDLVVRHDLAARAGLPTDTDDGQTPSVGPAPLDTPLDLPAGFQPEGAVAAEDVRQAVYARGDESVSVFVQDGRLNWSGLPDGQLIDLGGLPAWVDGERSIAVIETAGSTVTVVGLGPEELQETLRGVPRPSPGFGERIGDLAEAVVETFGYAPVG